MSKKYPQSIDKFSASVDSQPRALSWDVVSPFIVPCVPTGMNTGSSTWRGRHSTWQRHSVVSTLRRQHPIPHVEAHNTPFIKLIDYFKYITVHICIIIYFLLRLSVVMLDAKSCTTARSGQRCTHAAHSPPCGDHPVRVASLQPAHVSLGISPQGNTPREACEVCDGWFVCCVGRSVHDGQVHRFKFR